MKSIINPEPRTSTTGSRPRRVVVVGGGITGLAAAHRLRELAAERQLSLEVHLLEASGRLGGVIQTVTREGFLLEAGPDSFITDRPGGIALAQRLGLSDEILETNPSHRRSFIGWRGRLAPIPEGFSLLAPTRIRPLMKSNLLTWRGKLRASLEPNVAPRTDNRDESIAEFVERRFGPELLERLVQPLVAGVYGADPRELSLQATLPRFPEMERNYGSILKAYRATGTDRATSEASGARYGLFVSFKIGMQTLVDALATRLPTGTVHLNARAVRLERTPQSHTGTPAHPYTLTLEDGRLLPTDAVCLATPAYQAGALLEPLDASLGARLREIPYGSAATMNLSYPPKAVPHRLDGFGFVVPASEGRAILGCTFASVKFPGRAPDWRTLLRVFFGGDWPEKSEDELVRAAREDLRTYLGVAAAPLWTVLRRWPRAMPHYRVGHLTHLTWMEARLANLPGIALAGNAYRGIGIPDSIQSGQTAAERLVDFVLR